MSGHKYKKAPVSEVILGATFKHQVIDIDGLFDLRSTLKKEYPNIELNSPLADVYLKDYKLSTQIDVDRVGPFRLRLRSESSRWLIQIQLNKIYLNWIRKDSDEVGNYPGYTKIKSKVDNVLDKFLEQSITSERGVDYYELTYQDRLKWEEYIDSLNDLHEIINLSTPTLGAGNDFNNVINEYTYPISSLNGYGITKIDTKTSIENYQILKFQNILRGYKELVERDKWFNDAHNNQLDTFEKIFRDSILNNWT